MRVTLREARMGRGEVHIGFWGANLREETTWKAQDNIKMDLQKVGWWGMDWIDLAQDRDRWRALVNAVIYFRVPLNAGNFLTS